jgi:hypothetical protein
MRYAQEVVQRELFAAMAPTARTSSMPSRPISRSVRMKRRRRMCSSAYTAWLRPVDRPGEEAPHDAAVGGGPWATLARSGVPVAAILMSAGFFLSSMGRDVTRPNRLIALVYSGAAALALGVVSLGIGLLTA